MGQIRTGLPGVLTYGAAKARLIGVAQGVRTDVLPRGGILTDPALLLASPTAGVITAVALLPGGGNKAAE